MSMATVRIGHKVTVALIFAIAGRSAAQAADSIVLERGPCFGRCPVYRVSIAQSGDVHFVWLQGADSGKTERRHIAPDRFAGLIHVAMFGQFLALPDTINGPYCRYAVTDQASAKVSLFLPNREKHIF